MSARSNAPVRIKKDGDVVVSRGGNVELAEGDRVECASAGSAQVGIGTVSIVLTENTTISCWRDRVRLKHASKRVPFPLDGRFGVYAGLFTLASFAVIPRSVQEATPRFQEA